MIKVILNANAKDRPGLVSEISGVIFSLNGNIAESKMLRLENIFSVIMAIEIPEKNKNKLDKKIRTIKNLNFKIQALDSFDEINDSYKYLFTLECLDNEGIINHFTNYFNNENINIDEMNTTTICAPTTGSLLFNLDSTITVPKKMNMEKLQLKLNSLSEKFNVTYNLLLLKSK
tara:strand:+ start:1257 stop:1778 length:522 start_codon:yes stop_codon:yes gene_type:complete